WGGGATRGGQTGGAGCAGDSSSQARACVQATCKSAWALLPAHARRLFDSELQAHELAALDRYLRILEQWSVRMNLVATRSRDEIIDRHLIDSLALARWARTARVAVDLGSGAGFPGVPLAV